MRTMIRIALISVVATGLSACTSSQQVARAPVQQQTQQAEKSGSLDVGYVARVERVARRRGIEVRWVNPPMKRGDATSH